MNGVNEPDENGNILNLLDPNAEKQTWPNLRDENGKKLPEFTAQEEEVLLLLERVTEAERLSRMKLKEMGGNKRRRGGEGEEEEVEKFQGKGKKSSNKKSKRR
ncbi:putative RNA helicase [Helianthus anomalus]